MFNLELANGAMVQLFKSPKFTAKDADPMGIGVIMDTNGGIENVENQFNDWKNKNNPTVLAVERGIINQGDYDNGEHHAWSRVVYLDR